MVTWRDFTSLFCLSLTILAVAALVTAAQNFVIVSARVVALGSALIDGQVPTRTVTVIIENSDRVFRIQRGTTVEYAVSDEDVRLVEIGSQVKLLISAHQDRAKLVSVEGRTPI